MMTPFRDCVFNDNLLKAIDDFRRKFDIHRKTVDDSIEGMRLRLENVVSNYTIQDSLTTVLITKLLSL